MKKIIILYLLIMNPIVLISAEYEGFHLEEPGLQEKNVQKTEEQENFFKKHYRILSDKVRNLWPKKPSPSYVHEPLDMDDAAYQEADEVEIEQNRSLADAREEKLPKMIESERKEQEALQTWADHIDMQNLVNNSALVKSLTVEEIETLDFQKISILQFANLSVESLKAILNQPTLLQKLSDDQIRAINPERLSEALKTKLSQPLDLDFVNKLSWQQIRQLLGDHTGLRLKNWLTKFKQNFTQDAFNYMQKKEEDPLSEQKLKSELTEEDYLKVQLARLPKSKRPVDVDTAIQYMKDGEQVFNSLESNPEDQSNINLNDYQTKIIQLQWYFYKLSILQDGRAFQSGAIQLNDPEGKIFNFLEGYAKLANKEYKSFWKSWGKKSYTRISSHFKGEVQGDGIGIDIDVSGDNLGLPLQVPHLLFGKLKNGNIFVKWEPHGMSTLPDIVAHAFSFIKTRGENYESKHSKDRIPADVKKEFLKLYKAKAKTTENNNTVNSNSIAGMLKLLSEPEKTSFIEYLSQGRSKNNPGLRNYQKSTVELRGGGESIIQLPNKIDASATDTSKKVQ